MLMVSCQKDEINTEDELLIGSELVSEERCVPSCDDCPTMTHCCCEVRVTGAGIDAQLRFCGDFLGCGPLFVECLFEGTINCPPIDGITLTNEFNVSDTLLLCIPQNEAFIIRNESQDLVSIEMKCNQSSTLPIALGVGEFVVIEVNGSCEPDQCN